MQKNQYPTHLQTKYTLQPNDNKQIGNNQKHYEKKKSNLDTSRKPICILLSSSLLPLLAPHSLGRRLKAFVLFPSITIKVVSRAL